MLVGDIDIKSCTRQSDKDRNTSFFHHRFYYGKDSQARSFAYGDERKHTCFVKFQEDTHYYGSFIDAEAFWTYYSTTWNRPRRFFWLIRSFHIAEEGTPLYLDIEWTQGERDDKDAERKLEIIEQAIRHAFRARGFEEITILKETNLSRPLAGGIFKHSYHLFVPEIFFRHNAEGCMREFVVTDIWERQLKSRAEMHYTKAGSMEAKPIVDLGVYTKNRAFRVPGSIKWDKENKEGKNALSLPSREFFLATRLSSYRNVNIHIEPQVAGQTANSTPQRRTRGQTQTGNSTRKKRTCDETQTTQGGEDPTIAAEIQQLLETKGDSFTRVVFNPSSGYYAGKTHPQAGRECLVCQRKHDHENCYFIIRHPDVYYRCQAAKNDQEKKKGVLLGQLLRRETAVELKLEPPISTSMNQSAVPVVHPQSAKLTSEAGTAYHMTAGELQALAKTFPPAAWTDPDLFFAFTTLCKLVDGYQVWANLNTEKKVTIDTQSVWDRADTGYDGYIQDLFAANADGDAKFKKFNDLYKYKKAPTPSGSQPNVTFSAPHIPHEFFDTADCQRKNIKLKSGTGTGKTTATQAYFARHPELPFISVVSRVTLADIHHKAFTRELTPAEQKKMDVDGQPLQSRQVHHYKELNKKANYKSFNYDHSVVIQLDSLVKFGDAAAFHNHVVFLDEVNSMIEHLIKSPTLKNVRVKTLCFLIELLTNCHQIIAVDADLGDLTHLFLDSFSIGREFQFVENTFLSNKDVPAYELHSEAELMTELKDEKQWLLCMDSAQMAKIIYDKLVAGGMHAQTIKLITAASTAAEDTTQAGYIPFTELDKFDRVIYSPKIVYGIDSLIKRPVYAYYQENTIAPTGMAQQISRARHLTKLGYLFAKQQYKSNLTPVDEVRSEIKDQDSWGYKQFKPFETAYGTGRWGKQSHCGVGAEKPERKFYLELLTQTVYTNNCYDTNKRVHFRKMLQQKGFVDASKGIKTRTDKITKEQKAEMKKTERDNFSAEHPRVKELNEYLQIPNEKIDEYKEIFLDSSKLADHWAFSNYIVAKLSEKETRDPRGVLLKKLSDQDDYNPNKVSSIDMKIAQILKLRALVGLPSKDATREQLLVGFPNYPPPPKIAVTENPSRKRKRNPDEALTVVKFCAQTEFEKDLKRKDLSLDALEAFAGDYARAFPCTRERKKNPDFTKLADVQHYLARMYRLCFGATFIKKFVDMRRSPVARVAGAVVSKTRGPRKYTYQFNPSEVDFHLRLIEFRHPIMLPPEFVNVE